VKKSVLIADDQADVIEAGRAQVEGQAV